MKNIFYSIPLFLIVLSSCGKDKFECDVQNQMASADDSSLLIIPTAFSPDDNMLNDVFRPDYVNMDSVHFEVYNTDNELIFETSDLDKSWSPDNIETGLILYHYKITAKSHQGYTYNYCGDFYSYNKCLPKGFDVKKLTFGDQIDLSIPGYFKDTSVEEIKICP